MGPCCACQQGKMKALSAPTSMSQPPLTIGAKIHVDIYPIPTSIGGNNFILMSIDGRRLCNRHTDANKIYKRPNKGMDKIIQLYQSNDFCSDDKNNLKATYAQLRLRKISHSFTPAGLHEKRLREQFNRSKVDLQQ